MPFEIPTKKIFEDLNEIAQGPLKKNAHLIDQNYSWPAENIQILKDSKLSGLLISKEFGGHGEGLLTMAKACEILGSSCASTSMCFGMHLVGSAVMSAKATKTQQEKFLRPIAEGKHWTTISLSEPGTGAHFYIPLTEMVQKGDSLVINGEKSFVTNGGHADSFVLSAVVPSESRALGQFSCAIIPKDSKGISWGAQWKGFGMRGNSSTNVHLKDVKVPLDYLLGNIGDQLWYVFEVIAPSFLVAMSGTYLGIANAALLETIEHLKNRQYEHSGSSLASFQVLQHRIGELWAQVERTRQLIYSAAALGDNNDPNAPLSIMSAKAEVGECVVSVVNECMTLRGGESYSNSGDMGRHLRDARAAHVMAPTTDILRVWTGRALLGLPILGD
jgi:alkylation response protein AidB-like acyl-CoA dehydrogenase